MGLYRRGKTWYIRYQDADGKIIRESTKCESKQVAAKLLAKRKTDVAEGTNFKRKKVTPMSFYDFCDVYWKRHGQYKRSHSTQSVLKVLKAHFGDRKLTEFTLSMIEDFRNQRRKEVKISSINRNLAELRSMFSKAIQWGYTEVNPVKEIKFAKENNQRTRFLTHEEIRRLMGTAAPHLKPIITTALHTGMRRGEILPLSWESVNLKTRIITVIHTKNQEPRQIPLDNILYETLSKLPSQTTCEYVFPNRKGEPYKDIKKGFKAALKRAGITGVRFHDLRHTFASHLVMNGADLATVKELLGHKDIKMTLRYSHLSPTHKERTMALIEKALSSGDTPTDTVGSVKGQAGAK